jgi:hypothetical protein
MPTASEIALAGGNEFAADIIDAAHREALVFSVFEALPLVGTRFQSLVWKSDAPAGGFLRRGQGYTRSQGVLVKGEVNAARMGFMVNEPKSTTLEFDKQLQQSGIRSPGWLQLNARSRFASEIAYAEQQLFTGTANDALGFLGMKEICAFIAGNVLALTDAPEAFGYGRSVVNAGGNVALTADSVYTVNMGPLGAHLRVGGENGIAGFLKLGKVMEQFGVDPDDATREQLYLKAEAEGYIGFNVMGSSEAYADRKYVQYCVRRAANVTVANPVTETLLDYMFDMHPDGNKPNIIFMSKRGQRQLRDSRSAAVVTQIGMGIPGDAVKATARIRLPLPTEHNGVPIVATERIASNQAIET